MTQDSPQELKLRVCGMDCAEEIALLKRELTPLVGNENRLSFDLLNRRLTIDMSPGDVRPEDLISAIGRTGLQAEQWQENQSSDGQQTGKQRNLRWLLTAASGLFGLAGVALQSSAPWLSERITGGVVSAAAILCYAIGMLAGLATVLPKAWRSLTSFRPDMNLLMSVAVLGAVAIGEWFEGATVAFLFSLSLLLESWSVGRARRAIAALMDLSPLTAHLRGEDGDLRDVPPGDVPIGATVVVRPGEKIPLDGRVLGGTSSVNQAPITGESRPVDKEPGEDVFAGTINGEGLLDIQTPKAAKDTTLARIIQMVSDAGSRRAPSEKWVERFAAVYTPIVMAIALLVLLIPPVFFAASWSDWFYRSLVLLVIACPCALVISTPVSVVAALAAAARHGVLIKGGLFVEIPARLRAIAFDKTGTLTRGEPRVVDVVPMSGHDETELLMRSGALEQNSNHPLAKAIIEETKRRGLELPPAEGFEIIPGKGASGVINGKRYWLGSHRYLEQRGQETPAVHEQLMSMQQAGRSVVVIGNQDHVCGFISLADAIREETCDTMRALHQAGLERLVMLTGDNEGTARAIAQEAGIDEVYAELLPEDKVAVVEDLVARYEQVAMIGDGVNDAPALARATLGLAMGAAGSDAAIETADIALMSDDLSRVPWLLRHSRRTINIIRQNITFSLVVKILFVLLTFGGYASLWAAIAADMGASLLVIANGLRLLRF